MSYLLQHGRHVADVAVLYPIAALQAAYKNEGGQHPVPAQNPAPKINGEAASREGGPTTSRDRLPGTLAKRLFHGARVDYTYLHPEVLAERCTVEGQKLILNNKEKPRGIQRAHRPRRRPHFRWGGSAKIKEFYDKGGVVISTSKLPTKSAEFGRDKEIQKMVGRRVRVAGERPSHGGSAARHGRQAGQLLFLQRNAAGGRSVLPAQSRSLGWCSGPWGKCCR